LLSKQQMILGGYFLPHLVSYMPHETRSAAERPHIIVKCRAYQ